MYILISKTPIFKGRRALWDKYKESPTHLCTILEDFGIDTALRCTPPGDTELLAFDIAERVIQLTLSDAAGTLLNLIEATAEGFTSRQKLGKARTVVANIAPLGSTPYIRAATAAILAASMIPPDLANVAELAATAKRHEAYARAKAIRVTGGAWAAGEKAYNEEREMQKEIFRAYFN